MHLTPTGTGRRKKKKKTNNDKPERMWKLGPLGALLVRT